MFKYPTLQPSLCIGGNLGDYTLGIDVLGGNGLSYGLIFRLTPLIRRSCLLLIEGVWMCDIDPSCLVLECITRMCSSILNTFSHCIYSGAGFHIRNLMRY